MHQQAYYNRSRIPEAEANTSGYRLKKARMTFQDEIWAAPEEKV
jgi:hypothetical protein